MKRALLLLLIPVAAVAAYLAMSGQMPSGTSSSERNSSEQEIASTPRGSAPTVRWTSSAQSMPNGRMHLAFKVESSSPLRSLQVKISPASSSPAGSPGIPSETRDVPTWLMGNKSIDWDGEIDLTSSLLAGQTAMIQIVAEDEDRRTGTSDTTTLALPERRFSQPLAGALYTLRKSLQQDPSKRGPVLKALASLLQQRAPFENQDLTLLTLRSAAVRIALDNTTEGMQSALNLLWHAALLFEENPVNVTVSLVANPAAPPKPE